MELESEFSPDNLDTTEQNFYIQNSINEAENNTFSDKNNDFCPFHEEFHDTECV